MKRWLLAFFGFSLLAFLAACGGDDNKDSNSSSSQPAAAPSVAAVQTINMKMGEKNADVYFADPDKVKVTPGNIKLTLTNVGPERAHNIVIKQLVGDGELAKIERVEVGQAQTVEFAFAQEGTYQFICSFRGHAEKGAAGSITVSKSVS
jgi:plastocyanin